MTSDERKTSYRTGENVDKCDERIRLRGLLDSLLAKAVLTSAYAEHFGYTNIEEGTKDMVRAVKELVRADAAGDSPNVPSILGMSLDELRTVSHNPKAELGLDHYFPNEYTDLMTAYLNVFRTDVRSCELAFCCAPETPETAETQKILNRLSSAAYLLMLECRSERA